MPEAILVIADAIELLEVFSEPDGIVLLPASGDRTDTAAIAIATAREQYGLATRIAVPSWRATFIDGIDSRLAAARTVAVIDGTTGDRGDPLTIDLPARYLSPLGRGRILASRRPLEASLDAWRRTPLAFSIVRVRDDLWLETRDPIVAELMALTVREMHAKATERRSPWEDELVQLASEFTLGAATPQEIILQCRGDSRRIVQEEIVLALHLRIGVDIPLT